MKISFVSVSYKSYIDVSYEGFYYELLNHIICPENQKKVGVAIQCNEETKLSITKYLKSLHVGNEVNALIAFFERIPVGNCYYIIPIELDEDSMDELRNKLIFYNEKYDEEYVKEKMTPYNNQNNYIKKEAAFYYDNYIQRYYKFGKIQKLGTTNRKQRKCIYCGKTQNDGATFRNISHAIPEGLGNKKLIQNEECDQCNDEFGKGIEKTFMDFVGIIRTLGGIRGKENKIPTYIHNNIKISYEDNENSIEKIKIDIPEENHSDLIRESSSIRIEDLYRFLCKMVIGVIDKDYRSDLTDIIQWVRYGDVPNGIDKEKYQLPPIAIRMEEEILTEPDIIVFIRNNNIHSIPYCFSCLRVANLIFVYVLPFIKKDDEFIDIQRFGEFFNKTLFKNKEFIFTKQFNDDSLYYEKIVPIKKKI